MDYELSIRTPKGVLVDIIDDELSLDASIRVNDVGTLTVNIPCCDAKGNDRYITDYPRDYRIELCVQCDCGTSPFLFGDAPFLIRKIEKCRKGGKCSFSIAAYHANDILRRRLVPYLPKSNEAKSSGQLADYRIMRLFKETAGNRAGHYKIQDGTNDDPNREAAYNAGLIDYDHNYETNVSCGAPYNGKLSGKTALASMQDIATASEAKGNPVYFGIVQGGGCGSTALTFITKCGYWGTDRTASGRVISSEQETATDMCVSLDYSREVNYVYSQGGDDAGDPNNYSVTPSDDLAAILADDPFALVEKLITDKSWETNSERVDAANTEFGKVQILQFSGTLRNSPDFCFGKDWNFGDKMRVAEDGITFDAIVSGLHLSSSAGNVNLTADLTAGQKSGSVSGLKRMLQDMSDMRTEIAHLRALAGL